MTITLVNEHLLSNNNLKYDHLYSMLEHMGTQNIDFADLYFQSHYNEIWIMESGIIKSGSYNTNQGVGVRAIIGEKTGFAYANQITLSSLKESVVAACNISNTIKNDNYQVKSLKQKISRSVYPSSNPIISLHSEEKIALLHQINQYARNMDSRVQEVTAQLSSVYEEILVIATDGTLAADIRPLVYLSINIQVEEKGKREQSSNGGGGRTDYNFFLQSIDGEIRAEKWTREAVNTALINLAAIAAPAGEMPVVLGPGWSGVLLHEAVGHGLEGDFNRRGTSVFSGRIGEQVASELCTIVDDATLMNLRGSLTIDDEGTPGQLNVLIKDGCLQGYMQDKLNAHLLGTVSTGNGRRESYAYLPLPRMTNTYMLPGKTMPNDIISSVENGIYVRNLGGGQVDITSGKFVFFASEAYIIKRGHLHTPVKGVTFIGSGINVMQQISMIGNDLTLDNGLGTCSKDGQNIPVGVGQPTLKLDKITVGGTI